MRTSILVLALSAASLISTSALANTDEKKYSVGLSSFATSVDFVGGTDDATGIGVTATAVLNELGKGHLAAYKQFGQYGGTILSANWM